MTTYALTVNGSPVTLGLDASLEALEIRYGAPRRLTLTCPRDQGLALNSTITLTVDGVVRFRGRIVTCRPDAQASNKTTYTAVDHVETSTAIQIEKFRTGTAAYKLAVAFAFSLDRELAEILDLATDVYGPELLAAGAVGSASSVFSGATSGTLPAFSLTTGTFPDFLNAVTAGMPGYRWLYNPTSQTFQLVNVFTAPTRTIELPAAAVESLDLQYSIENRFTKIVLTGTATNFIAPTGLELVPGWDTDLEADWSPEAITAQDGFDDAYIEANEAVYRKWSFASQLDTITPDFDQPVDLRQKVKYRSDPESYKWISVQVSKIDWENGFVWAAVPTLKGGPLDRDAVPLASQPGKSQQPHGMALRYYARNTLPPPQATAGFGGTAFTEFGLRRERTILEPENRNVTAERARMYLNAFGDVTASGSIPVAGDMPSWAWNLGARVNIASARRTLADAMRAVVVGCTYQFGDGGVAVLELDGDLSAFIGSVQL